MWAAFRAWEQPVLITPRAVSIDANGERALVAGAPFEATAWVQPSGGETIDDAEAATASLRATLRAAPDLTLGPFDTVEAAGVVYEVEGVPVLKVDPLAGVADHVRASLVMVVG